MNPDILQRSTIDIEFQRGGQVLYRGTTYVGFVIILNAVQKDKFALSWNQRFVKRGKYTKELE